MIIYNVRICTMDKENNCIENGYIEIENGKIKHIGKMPSFHSFGYEDDDINAKGQTAYPGFIDAHTHLGMFGDSVGIEDDDGNEDSDPITPHLRAIDAINPMEKYFDEAVSAGITTVITGPGSTNPIAGQLAAIKTFGKRIDKMTVKAPVGIKFALGENPKATFSDKEQSPVTRMATAALIRETLKKAEKYYKDKINYENDRENYDCPEYDMKYEALIPLFKKEIPAHFHVHRADDIFTAVRICKEFDIDYVLVHATDAYLICDELSEENMLGILSGPILTDRSKPELKNLTPKSTGILANNHIKTAVVTDHPETPVQYLVLCAAVAVKEGMDRTDALRAITSTPAEICGISNRVGSLEVGKDADILLYSGDPLDIMNSPDSVIINGKIIK